VRLTIRTRQRQRALKLELVHSSLWGDVPRMKPLRVLTIDGGGMRGAYTAAFLAGLTDLFAKERGAKNLDLGKGFDLIVGTSTGAILACGAAIGTPMADIVRLYSEHGPAIFPMRLHTDLRMLVQIFTRPAAIRSGAAALNSALSTVLGENTFGDVFRDREIALSIPAVEMGQQRSWVFKTPHWGGVRDINTRLADACMASSAAPVFRSLAAIDADDGMPGHRVFADGGLWANNPVLVGLVDALAMDPVRPIEIFAVGSVPKPEGEEIAKSKLDRGPLGWGFGGKAAQLSIAAQEFAFDNMARMLAANISTLGRSVKVMRFPAGGIQPSLLPHLDIDNASPSAISALISQARSDVLHAKSAADDLNNPVGVAVRDLFANMPRVD
jgi:predicted acylesterase/phospholipase RssA